MQRGIFQHIIDYKPSNDLINEPKKEKKIICMLFIKDVEWRLTLEYEAGGHLFQIDKGGNQAAREKSPYFLLT